MGDTQPTAPARAAKTAAPPAPPGASRWLGGILGLHAAVLAAWVLGANWNLQPGICYDHGRDLLCYARVAAGQVPYVDFQWIYGPLIPWVYAGLFHLVGASLAVVRDGFLVLVATGAALACLAARRPLGAVAAHGVAITALLWGGPPHTYNQAALLPISAAGLWALLQACAPGPLRFRRLAPVYLAGLAAGLVKWNGGLAWIAAATLALLVRIGLGEDEPADPRSTCADRPDPGRRRATYGVLLMAAVTAFLLVGAWLGFREFTPDDRWRLCFSSDIRYGFRRSVLSCVTVFPDALCAALAGREAPGWGLLDRTRLVPFLFLASVATGAAWAFLRAWKGRAWDGEAQRLLVLWILTVVLAQEFVSVGSPYTLLDLDLPPLLLLSAGLARRALRRTPVRLVVPLRGLGAVAWALFATAWVAATVEAVAAIRNAPLVLPRGGGLRVWSEPQREELEATSACIARLTAPGEPVAVLQYEPEYSFLADRPSPFYANLVAAFRFTDADESEMIRALDAGPVRCVVVMNSALSLHPADGILGYTHLQRLARHVGEHYEPVAWFGFGPWDVFGNHPEGMRSTVFWRKGLPRPGELPR